MGSQRVSHDWATEQQRMKRFPLNIFPLKGNWLLILCKLLCENGLSKLFWDQFLEKIFFPLLVERCLKCPAHRHSIHSNIFTNLSWLCSFILWPRINPIKAIAVPCSAWSLSCVWLWDCMDCSPPGSSVHGILQQEYWNGLPCPPPGDLPNPGI